MKKHIFPEHPVLKGVRYLRPHLPPHLLQPLHAGGRKGLSRLGEDQGLYQVFLLVDVNVVDFVAFVVSNVVKVAAVAVVASYVGIGSVVINVNFLVVVFIVVIANVDVIVV